MPTSSRYLLGIMKMCSLCGVAPALCPAWPTRSGSQPLILGITESPNRRIAEALILTESRIARRCRAIRRDSDNPGDADSGPPLPGCCWRRRCASSSRCATAAHVLDGSQRRRRHLDKLTLCDAAIMISEPAFAQMTTRPRPLPAPAWRHVRGGGGPNSAKTLLAQRRLAAWHRRCPLPCTLLKLCILLFSRASRPGQAVRANIE